MARPHRIRRTAALGTVFALGALGLTRWREGSRRFVRGAATGVGVGPAPAWEADQVTDGHAPGHRHLPVPPAGRELQRWTFDRRRVFLRRDA